LAENNGATLSFANLFSDFAAGFNLQALQERNAILLV
jgi:hypothetical protein